MVKRRKMLLGLGSLAAGGAAAMGTGAFTSVAADRDVEIATRGDASAYLQIEAMDTPNGNKYVVEDSNGEVGLKFTGVNKNADSKFANLLKITNQGTQDVYVGAEDSGIQAQSVGVFCEGPDDAGLLPKAANQPDSDIDGDGDTEQGGAFEYPEDPVVLSPGDTAEGVALAWDSGNVPSDGTYTLTILAQDVDNYPAKP
jgi:hypothetical protein